MNNELQTLNGMLLSQRVLPELAQALRAFNELRFDQGKRSIADVDEVLNFARRDTDEEHFLNDLFILDKYVRLMERYGLLWDAIVAQRFSASWVYLQDGLDLLRLIKRLSSLDVSFFENQLLELEAAYPYKIFASIGATIRYFECSICGQDIDSMQCPHVKGELYRGVMAYGIAHEISRFDHVSLVINPEDKRCVISYEDTSKPFALIRYISGLISARKLQVLAFERLDWSKRKRLNPEFAGLGRNDLCTCGSGKKFKRCCIGKREVEIDHAEVIGHQRDVSDVIVLLGEPPLTDAQPAVSPLDDTPKLGLPETS